MNKKTIKTLAAIFTSAVIFAGSYIIKSDDIDFRHDISSAAAGEQSSTGKSSDTQYITVTFPYSIVDVKNEGIEPFGHIDATVTKVTDGDTLRVEYKKKEYKVRLLDIDTPESVKSGVDPQPFSEEASELSKKTLTGKKVKLVFEKGTTDQYDRLLAHLILEDGTFYNAMMVQNGYAICVFYSPNTLLKGYYAELQKDAIQNNRGFWALPEEERPFVEDSKGKFTAAYKVKKDAA